MADVPVNQPRERGIHLLTIAGIRIIIDYSWFIIFVLVVEEGRLEGLVTKTGVVRLLEIQRVLGGALAGGADED